MTELKQTPLFPIYKSYGGKTIDFGGWDLPVQFSSIKEEHFAVRTKAGLFDVSHMGEIEVKGPDSLSYLQSMMTNDVTTIKDNRAQYTAMCYDDGGTVDDLLVYRYGEEHFLLVVNAANIEKDFQWLLDHVKGNVNVTNVSDEYAQLALQGPIAEEVLQSLASNQNLNEIKFFQFRSSVLLNGKPALVSRTGYTGEDGFEIYCAPKDAKAIWESILEAGKGEVLPCGLGSRDTLRFEANLALYGQELSKNISPLEAGIGFAVKTQKEADFHGKNALIAQKENGIPRKLVGIEMIERGIPRHGYPVYAGEELIGEITSGTQSPTLKKNIGVALVKREQSELGSDVFVEIRGKKVAAQIVATPFYKRSKF